MSVEDVEENKAGWAMPMTLKLEKGNSVDYSLLEPIASVGLGDSGYMEYLSKAIFYYKKGNKQISSGNYQEALESYSRGVNKDSLHIDSYFNRGICNFKLGHKELACKDWGIASDMGDMGAAKLLLDKFWDE